MICLALPCALALLLTACGDDEPSYVPPSHGGGNGGGTSNPSHQFTDYFTAGGVKYDYYRSWDNSYNSSAAEYASCMVLSVGGYSEGYASNPFNNSNVSCQFCIENFNYKSARPGTMLHIIDSDRFSSYLNYIRYDKKGNRDHKEFYSWGYDVPAGSVKFVSYTNGILTLEVDITMNDADPYDPNYITLYGTVKYQIDGNYNPGV